MDVRSRAKICITRKLLPMSFPIIPWIDINKCGREFLYELNSIHGAHIDWSTITFNYFSQYQLTLSPICHYSKNRKGAYFLVINQLQLCKMPTLKLVCFDVSPSLVSDTRCNTTCMPRPNKSTNILPAIPSNNIYLVRNRVFLANVMIQQYFATVWSDATWHKDPWGQTNPIFLSTPAFHPRNSIMIVHCHRIWIE